jgi:hypothetical protein
MQLNDEPLIHDLHKMACCYLTVGVVLDRVRFQSIDDQLVKTDKSLFEVFRLAVFSTVTVMLDYRDCLQSLDSRSIR